jgi:hypothetical protein
MLSAIGKKLEPLKSAIIKRKINRQKVLDRMMIAQLAEWLRSIIFKVLIILFMYFIFRASHVASSTSSIPSAANSGFTTPKLQQNLLNDDFTSVVENGKQHTPIQPVNASPASKGFRIF